MNNNSKFDLSIKQMQAGQNKGVSFFEILFMIASVFYTIMLIFLAVH